MRPKHHSEVITRLADLYEKNTKFEKELYEKHNVKRGLREIDGTGVVVGLTDISDVIAKKVVDGKKVPVDGELYYRGINVQEIIKANLGNRFCFEEIIYLLLFNKLPNKAELDEFCDILAEYRKLPKNFVKDVIMKTPSRDIMNMMSKCILTLYAYDHNPADTSIINVLDQCLKLIAVFPLLAVYSYHAHRHYNEHDSLFIHNPEKNLSIAENFLRILRPDCAYTELEAQVLDVALILHAEHGGGNNSSFTTHVVTSSGTDTYSAMTAAMCSLKGPKHGGANIKVMEMFADIRKNVKNWKDKEELTKYLGRMLDGEVFDKKGLIYGMGHAVYSISDPRAIVFKDYVRRLAKEKGREKEFEFYTEVESISQQLICERKNIHKGVSANVDFYSGFAYSMLGLPLELYTPVFAIARIAGWSAHRLEELLNSGKIIRPAYISVNGRNPYVKMEDRK